MTSAIVTASYTRTATGLRFNDNVTFEEWEAIGTSLSKEYSGLQWAIGDWINYGEYAFGEKYAQALDATHYNYGTLRNYASICARIPPPVRPSELLFHQIKHVAQLDDYAQQQQVIEMAVRLNLTGDEVLEVVQEIVGKPARAQAITGEYKGRDQKYYRVVVIELDVVNNDLKPGDRVIVRLAK